MFFTLGHKKNHKPELWFFLSGTLTYIYDISTSLDIHKHIITSTMTDVSTLFSVAILISLLFLHENQSDIKLTCVDCFILTLPLLLILKVRFQSELKKTDAINRTSSPAFITKISQFFIVNIKNLIIDAILENAYNTPQSPEQAGQNCPHYHY